MFVIYSHVFLKILHIYIEYIYIERERIIMQIWLNSDVGNLVKG